MIKTKANNYRWKHGVSNVKASSFMKKSMYDAGEVVRLMTEFAQSEVKKFHKPAVIKSVCEHDYYVADSINNMMQCRKCGQVAQQQTVL